MKNYLWKFEWDCCGRGNVEGLFVATEQEVNGLLGKDSEVNMIFEDGEITKVDLDTETVDRVTSVLGGSWDSYNPTYHIEYGCCECGCFYDSEEFNLEKNMCNYCVEE